MFTSSVREGKAFASEEKIRQLKSRISDLNAQIKNYPDQDNTEFSP